MENIINLYSEDGTVIYLKKLKRLNGEESKTYLIKTNMPTFTVGYIEGNKKFIDLSRGPTIIEGSLLKEANAVVKSIDSIIGYGYTITFE